MRPAQGMVARIAWPAAAVAVVLALASVQAGAAVTPAGACTASLNGIDVTSGHDTTGTAVHVDASSDPQFTGEAPGETVDAFRLSLQLAGLDLGLHPGKTNGSQWANTVEVSKYSWAAIGLYRLVGTATDGSGTPICTTTAYMCVDGKLAVLTVVGALAVLAGLAAVFLLVRGFMMLRWRSRVRVAYRLGGAGLLGGIAVPLLLQQNCVVGLTRTIVLGSALGGLVGMALLGLALGGGRRHRPSREAPSTALFTVPDQEQQRQHQTVYRLQPAEEACPECVEHAAHRTYRTEEAAGADRAHEGCTCLIVSELVHDPFFVSRFKDGDVIDDREG